MTIAIEYTMLCVHAEMRDGALFVDGGYSRVAHDVIGKALPLTLVVHVLGSRPDSGKTVTIETRVQGPDLDELGRMESAGTLGNPADDVLLPTETPTDIVILQEFDLRFDREGPYVLTTDLVPASGRPKEQRLRALQGLRPLAGKPVRELG